MLYAFFLVIPRFLNLICRRFGTLCSIFIGGVSRKNNWDSDWLKLFSSQTFSHTNTPTISSRLFFLLIPTMKMEHTECSETSAYKIQTLGNHPPHKKRKQHFRYCPGICLDLVRKTRKTTLYSRSPGRDFSKRNISVTNFLLWPSNIPVNRRATRSRTKLDTRLSTTVMPNLQ